MIGHDERAARIGFDTTFLQELGQWQGAFFEFAIRPAVVFTLAVGFDQTGFVCEAIQRDAQRRAERGLLGKVDHFDLGVGHR